MLGAVLPLKLAGKFKALELEICKGSTLQLPDLGAQPLTISRPWVIAAFLGNHLLQVIFHCIKFACVSLTPPGSSLPH